MHHESEWGPRLEREYGDEVHILGKKIEPAWPFLDGLVFLFLSCFKFTLTLSKLFRISQTL